jgi:hypothetical protein
MNTRAMVAHVPYRWLRFQRLPSGSAFSLAPTERRTLSLPASKARTIHEHLGRVCTHSSTRIAASIEIGVVLYRRDAERPKERAPAEAKFENSTQEQGCGPTSLDGRARSGPLSGSSISKRGDARMIHSPRRAQRQELKWCNGRHPVRSQTTFARQIDRAAPAQSILFLSRSPRASHPRVASQGRFPSNRDEARACRFLPKSPVATG